MSFGIYLVGYIILIAGLAIGANLLHVPMQWIGVGILCLRVRLNVTIVVSRFRRTNSCVDTKLIVSTIDNAF